MCEVTATCPTCDGPLTPADEISCVVMGKQHSINWLCPRCGASVALISTPPLLFQSGGGTDGE